MEIPEQVIKNTAGDIVSKIPAYTKQVPIRPGRRARLSELSRLTDEQALELAPDIVQAGQRGFANASPELRKALGIQDPQLRFMGVNIPGTQPIANKVVQAGGHGRALLGQGIEQLPGLSRLGRGPRNMEAVTATLAKGSNQMPIDEALDMVRIYDKARLVKGQVTTGGNTELRRFVRKVIDPLKKDKTAINKLVRDAETPGEMTPFNDLMATLATIYERRAGVSLEDFKRDPTSYVPHMRTAGFKRMVKRGFDQQRSVHPRVHGEDGVLCRRPAGAQRVLGEVPQADAGHRPGDRRSTSRRP